MPHVNGADGDDLGDSDEIKIYKHDEECEEEKKLLAEERQSDSLTEDKSSLVTEGETQSKSSTLPGQSYVAGKSNLRPEPSPLFGRGIESLPHPSALNMGYFMSPYHYHNGMGLGTSIPTMGGKVLGAPPPGSPLPFFYPPGSDPLSQPPPAHMGLPRPPMYPFPAAQYGYPMLGTEMAQLASWHNPGMYQISSAAAAAAAAAAGFRGPYSTGFQLSPSSLPRFSPTLLGSHGLHAGHAALMGSGHPALSGLHHVNKDGPPLAVGLLVDQNHRGHMGDPKGPGSSGHEPTRTMESQSNHNNNNPQSSEKKKPHIKKPLNAFMLYMKEMRAKVVAECTLKESAAINQILGRRWHTLSREEQSRYYDMARQQRQLHMQLYPNWTSRDSVASGGSRKRRTKRDKAADGANSAKKCRARFGLDQQNRWCKPCRRKKKCIRYLDGGDEADHSEDNLGSAGSVEEPRSPDSKVDGMSSDSEGGEDDEVTSPSDLGLSSPGLSLSSLASPAMILPSPSTSLASPCPLTPSPATPGDKSVLGPGPSAVATSATPSIGHYMGQGNHHHHVHHHHHHGQHHLLAPPPRHPIGTNPHDINNPLSVNQLTGQCNNSSKNTKPPNPTPSSTPHTILSVT